MKRDYWNEATENAFKGIYPDPYGAGILFEDIRPALRFGWNHALADEYPNETWEEVEEDMERAWQEAHSQHGQWSEIKKHVRQAWEKARADWQGLVSSVQST